MSLSTGCQNHLLIGAAVGVRQTPNSRLWEYLRNKAYHRLHYSVQGPHHQEMIFNEPACRRASSHRSEELFTIHPPPISNPTTADQDYRNRWVWLARRHITVTTVIPAPVEQRQLQPIEFHTNRTSTRETQLVPLRTLAMAIVNLQRHLPLLCLRRRPILKYRLQTAQGHKHLGPIRALRNEINRITSRHRIWA